jgi:hypothetical protein
MCSTRKQHHSHYTSQIRQVSVFGPGRALSRRVNLSCVLPTLDGDAKRIHGSLSWFGQKKALCPAGKGEYCISLHLSACVGITSHERGSRSQVSKKEYNGVLLEMLISEVGRCLSCFSVLRCPSSPPESSLPSPFIDSRGG